MFARMLRTGRVLALAALAAAVASCGGKPDRDAAADVQAFLAAVQARDPAGFENNIDRPALRVALRAQVVELARAAGLEGVGGPSEFALDRMIGPDNVRLVDSATGEPLGAAPTVEQIRPLLKPVDKQTVCLHDSSPEQACLLVFAKQRARKESEGGARSEGWRLVRMPASHMPIPIGPAPAA